MAAKNNAASKPRERKAAALAVIEAAGNTPKLDSLIHDRIRLGILSALSVNPSLTFGDLKKLLDASDGNLSVHARKLEEAGYIECAKSFEGRMPRTCPGAKPSTTIWITWKR
jgi:DNA-binding transcriptional ArsR family regulator